METQLFQFIKRRWNICLLWMWKSRRTSWKIKRKRN